jgi:hypothetical protein
MTMEAARALLRWNVRERADDTHARADALHGRINLQQVA